MTRVREWLRRLGGAVWSGRSDRELEDELRSHLELATEDAQSRYDTETAARRAARLDAGNVLQAMEGLRRQRTVPWLGDVGRDIRYAFRMLRRHARFASVAVVTLALAIGANTAIFTLADAVLLRPLPVGQPRELVLLRQRSPTTDIWPFTSAAAEELARPLDVLSGLAVFRPLLGTHVRVDHETELTTVQLVSGNYHGVLGVTPALGRTLTEGDREPVAVISDRYWRRRFNADAGVLGRTLEMQGRSFTIIGVTHPEFFGTQPGRHVDVTAPLAAGTMKLGPNARWLYLIGRLKPGVSRERAEAALRVHWAQVAPRVSSGAPATLHLDPGAQGMNELRREFSVPLRILTAAMAVVLLLACANLAGLLTARSAGRQQDIAVRQALGASRGRIVRQLLTESVLLAAAGGAAGIALAQQSTGWLLAMMARGRGSIAVDVAPNARTLAFAGAVTLLAAVLFGALPALTSSRTRLHPALKTRAGANGAPRRGWGRAMVAAQVALLVLLLTFAGLFAGTLLELQAVDPGFRQGHVFVASVSPGPAFRGAASRRLNDDLDARFSALPGVQSVSASMDTPFGGEMSMSAGIVIPGRPPDPDDAPPVYHNLVGPRFFETMGIAILAGRDFTHADDERAERCVVISESVARRYFADTDPIGRQLVLDNVRASIVGVVTNVRYTSLRTDAPLVIYRGYRQEPGSPANTFLIRTSLSQAALTAAVHAELREAAPLLPLPGIVSVDDQIAGALVTERMLATLSGAVGVAAALLAAIGIYSTVASAVTRRRREIGIRLALGGQPGQILRMVLAEACAVVAVGLAAGILVALAVGQWARELLVRVLFNFSPSSPTVLMSATTAIVLVASVAAYLPARRACRTNLVAVMKPE